jgi:hypothetical protein
MLMVGLMVEGRLCLQFRTTNSMLDVLQFGNCQ